ncbi:hypothetical protein [Nostoc sp. DedQUE09]|uniref:hypothetical protein n=1 Tax=Nostoc sp. DedQUE09 TaxID=3075394 RepID=UPI003A0FE90F
MPNDVSLSRLEEFGQTENHCDRNHCILFKLLANVWKTKLPFFDLNDSFVNFNVAIQN